MLGSCFFKPYGQYHVLFSGKVLQSIDIPAERVTSVCFGGDNLDELYVTSSRSHYSEAQLAKQPLAGSLFKITGLGSKGLPANIFEG